MKVQVRKSPPGENRVHFQRKWTARQAAEAVLGCRTGDTVVAMTRRIQNAIRADIIPAEWTSRTALDLGMPAWLLYSSIFEKIETEVIEPADAIRWAINEGDIEITSVCLEWFARKTGETTITPSKSRLKSPIRERSPITKELFRVGDDLTTKQGSIPKFDIVWNALLEKPPVGYTRQGNSLKPNVGAPVKKSEAKKSYRKMLPSDPVNQELSGS